MSTSSATDSATHMALDPIGNLYTISSTYAGMSDQQKSDANRFARVNPNGIAAVLGL